MSFEDLDRKIGSIKSKTQRNALRSIMNEVKKSIDEKEVWLLSCESIKKIVDEYNLPKDIVVDILEEYNLYGLAARLAKELELE